VTGLAGAFAEAQAQFLQPKGAEVDQLAQMLSSKRIGVVAHFYMDPEVGGWGWGPSCGGFGVRSWGHTRSRAP
jgi:hypothetical protein